MYGGNVFLHFVSSAEISVETLASFYGMIVEKGEYNTMKLFGLVFNSLLYCLIQLVVIKYGASTHIPT